MKPEYKNWVSKSLKNSLMLGTMVLWTMLLMCGITASANKPLRTVLTIVLGAGFAVCLYFTVLCVNAYDAFDYNGKRRIAKRIIDGIAENVILPDGATCIDVGCGTGALTIACARKNPGATVVGVDIWRNGGADKNHKLCKKNADIEGVGNVAFSQGDALALDFDDGTFDAVVSNYCYHTIRDINCQDAIMESLRVLKKGGVFVIHDIMKPEKFGDMQAFVQKLLDMGYSRAELVDTTSGMFVTAKTARLLRISPSVMLIGIK